MRRREFIAFVGSAGAWPFIARGDQSPRFVVGFLHSGTADTFASEANSFRAGVKETGPTENQNVEIEYRWANNNVGELPKLAADLVRRQVAVILAGGPAAAVGPGLLLRQDLRRRSATATLDAGVNGGLYTRQCRCTGRGSAVLHSRATVHCTPDTGKVAPRLTVRNTGIVVLHVWWGGELFARALVWCLQR
jgi:hypothetical protein